MKTALITGLGGQDGSYLAELLLEKGYRIIGAVRDVRRTEDSLPITLKNKVELVAWSMLIQEEMVSVMRHYQPTELYNFAAYSSGAGMYDDPVGIGDVNGLAVVRILEAIREVNIGIRFCQASSREIFGEPFEGSQTECTRVNPRSPYGAAKLYADSMIRIYRQHYGLFACSAILFNHESPRRSLGFVTRKITHGAAKIKLGLSKELYLGNLDACRDWGFAGDYVRAMWLMLQQSQPTDCVIATGESHSVQEFCARAFKRLGLDCRQFLVNEPVAYRPAEPVPLVGDASKAKEVLGWEPQIRFCQLVDMMVDADLQMLEEKNNKLVESKDAL